MGFQWVGERELNPWLKTEKAFTSVPKQQVSNDDNRFSSFPTLEDIGFIQIHSIEQDHQEQELNRHLPFILFASLHGTGINVQTL
ncbi:hypothetical protein BLOT_011738 [Blomia tropicalis]|nr:hypothetical protein BLOT_011738 [Blomia tropicalis]